MSHTQWEYEQSGQGINTKYVVLEDHKDFKEIICTVGSEANAKRICRTHNSHDFLLESAKNLVRAQLAGETVFIEIGFMEQAIAAAESE